MPLHNSFRLPPEQALVFDKHVAENCVNVSRLIQKLLKDYLESVKVKEAGDV